MNLDVPKKAAHSIIWVFLIGLGSFLMYVVDFSSSRADFSEIDLPPANVLPIIETHIMSSGGIITDGQTLTPPPARTAMSVDGTVRDDNGDLVIIAAVMYREGVGPGCIPDPRNCVTKVCTLIPNQDPTRTDYTCDFDLRFFSDDTVSDYSGEVWRIQVEANDGTKQAVDNTSYFEFGA